MEYIGIKKFTVDQILSFIQFRIFSDFTFSGCVKSIASRASSGCSSLFTLPVLFLFQSKIL